MVMRELSWIEVELDVLLTDIRSAVRLEVARFPGAGPHRAHREEMPGHQRREEKKKMVRSSS